MVDSSGFYEGVLEAMQKIEECGGIFGHPVQDSVHRLCGNIRQRVESLGDSLDEAGKSIADLHSLVERLERQRFAGLSEDQSAAVNGFRNDVLKLMYTIDEMRGLREKIERLRDVVTERNEKVQRLF